MSSRHRLAVTALTAISLVIAACSGGAGSSASPSSPAATPCAEPSASACALPSAGGSPGGSPAGVPSGEPVALTVGLGYIQSVQFAPFYLADQAGYYAEAGLDVEFQNRIDPDLIALVGQGAIDIGLGDGTSVIPAVSQGIPIRYVATVYGRFPSIVFAKTSSGIAEAADLAGRRLGIPGRFGSSWIMLQALLDSAGLTPDDLEIIEYPDFGQGAAVQQDAVAAATGFVNNEPVQLELSGESVVVLTVDDVVPLPGNGLIVGTSTLAAKRDAIAGFVAATLRAMNEIVADPQAGLDASIEAVPELGMVPETQAAILAATIEAWQGPAQQAGGLGAIAPDDWSASIDYLSSLDLVPNPVTTDDLIDTSLLPSG